MSEKRKYFSCYSPHPVEKYQCFRQGSNLWSSACKADVITTTLPKPLGAVTLRHIGKVMCSVFFFLWSDTHPSEPTVGSHLSQITRNKSIKCMILNFHRGLNCTCSISRQNTSVLKHLISNLCPPSLLSSFSPTPLFLFSNYPPGNYWTDPYITRNVSCTRFII